MDSHVVGFMLIAINNKDNLKEADNSYIAMTEQFKHNLCVHFADNPALQNKISQLESYLVNAKVALKGKQENKPVLVEYSQISRLEQAIAHLFATTNAAQIAQTLSFELIELLEKAKKVLKSQSKNAELDKVLQWFEQAMQAQKMLEVKMHNKNNKDKYSLTEHVTHLAMTDQTEDISVYIQDWYQENIEYYEHLRQRAIEKLNVDATHLVKLFASSPMMSRYFSHANSADNSEQAGAGINSLGRGLWQLINGSLQNPEITKKGMLFSLSKGKEWLPSLFKGIGPKGMEKIAGRFVPFVGPAVQVISSIYDFYAAQKEKEQQVMQQRQQIESIRAYSKMFVEESYNRLTEVIAENIEETFSQIISPFEEVLTALNKEVGSDEASLLALTRAQHALS